MQDQFTPHFAASNKAAMDFATLTFSQVERLAALSVEQAKVSAELAYEQSRALFEVKDPSAAIELFKTQMETSAKSLAGFAATAAELSEEIHAETSSFAQEHFDQAHASANKAIEELLKNAPKGSEVAVSAFKTAIDATNKAIVEARTSAMKTAEMAKQGLAKLQEHAPKVAKAPARRKAR